MNDPSITNQELLEENALLKQRIKELEQSEAERKQEEEDLRESEGRFTYLIESAPEAILVHSGGRFMYLNPRMLRLLGASNSDELLEHDIMERIAPEYHDTIRERIQSQRETSQPVPPMEQVYLRMDGSRVSVETTAVSIQFAGKDAHIVFVRDITERKLMEEKSHNLLNFLQTLFNTIPSPIFCKDINGLYQDFNKEFEVYTGKTRKEIMGKGVYDIYPHDVADKYHEMDLALFRQPGKQVYEHPITYADGTKHDVVVNKAAYLNADGTMAGLVGVMVDITEHKKTEEALRIAVLELQQYHDQLEDLVAKRTAELNRAYSIIAEREARFRSYFELPLNGIAIISPEKGWLEVNDRLCSIMGYTRNEIVSMTWSEMTHPDDLAADIEYFNRVLSGQIEQYTMDKRFIRKDGTVVWTSIAVGCVRKPDGTVDYIITLVGDITKRKQEEYARRETEQRMSDIIDFLPDATMAIDKDKRVIIWNRGIEEMTSIPAEEMLGKGEYAYTIPFYGVARPQLMDLFWEPEHEIVAKYPTLKREGENFVVEAFCPALYNGRGAFIWAKASPLRDSEGKLIGAIECIRDITESKQAEEELHEREANYRRLFDSSPAGIYQVDFRTGKFLKANDIICEYIGCTQEEISLYSPWDVLTDEGRQLLLERLGKMKSGEEITESPIYEVIVKDGRRLWLQLSSKNIYDSEGIVGADVVAHDITDQKKTEEQLHHTLDSLRKSFGATVQVMVSAVETRDPYTSGHQLRSADLARAIATEMGLPREIIEGLRMAGSIHDIGKMSVPAEILVKPTKLSELEFSLIKEHSNKGFEMLKDVESPWPLAEIVHQHHERMNGSGYPRQLKGEEIILEARILAVADVVEAMASHRPYRPAIGLDAAMAEIENNKGTLYDADAVDACLRLFREKGFQLEGT